MKNIIKRSGKEVPFDEEKILKAIQKANKSVDEENRINDEKISHVVSKVVSFIKKSDNDVGVEEIQDRVEEELMKVKAYLVSKNYIKYRYLKELKRDKYKSLMKSVKEKLLAENTQNQNANIDEHSFGGRIGEASDVVTKRYALEYLVSPMARENHLNNEIYIHDLNSYSVGSHNCAHGSMWVKIKKDGEPKTITLRDLATEINIDFGQLVDISKTNYEILSRDGWTKLINITKRKTREDECLYTLKTKTGLPLKLTGDHRVPVIRNGKEELLCVKDINIGDSLLGIENVQLSSEEINTNFLNITNLNDENIDLRIYNINPLKHYLEYKYGISYRQYATENKLFNPAGTNIKLCDFIKLINEFPLSIDLLSQLRISANFSKHEFPIYIPFSKSLAKLYGYIYADGGVYVDNKTSLFQLTFTNKNEELVDDFIDCYEDVFGYRLNKSYAKNWHTSPCIRVTDGCKIPVKIFKDFAGGRKYAANDIRIPDFIMNGNEDIKYAFLSAAIDTDGSISDNGIFYSTAGDEFSDQLVLLLEGLGFHPTKTLSIKEGSVYKVGVKTGKRNYNVYNVAIRRSDERYTLQSKIDTLKYNDSYVYKGLNNKFDENKIISIVKDYGEFDVYDLETKSHWYIINNYVSHNCLSVPFDDLLKNGFNTRQTDVRPAQSVNTAFQLVAVIFQLQSLQQFGSFSAC